MNTLVIEPEIAKLDFSSDEAIKMLRETVQMSGYQYKTISVTSAVPNEGKSYIAFHLAYSMAALGKKTVYVDCDIRNSNFKREHGIKVKTTGLSEFLCGRTTAADLIYSTTIPHLDFIFSGMSAPNPSELLSDPHFDQLIASLKKLYDYVIFDTPPVNVVVDGTIVSKKTDTTILVVKSFSTERAEAIRMKKQLETSGVRILGVVMNLHGVQASGYGKYIRKRYGYGKYGYSDYGYRNNCDEEM